jgi:hypothetical protein
MNTATRNEHFHCTTTNMPPLLGEVGMEQGTIVKGTYGDKIGNW